MANDAGEKEAVYSVPIDVIAVLGSAFMPVSQLLKLGRGAVVQLDRMVDEDIDVFANDQLIAHGEVTVSEDRLSVKVTSIIKSNMAKI